MRVLVVEDEPGIAKFIRQGLSEAGYVVDVASDGEDGLNYALATELCWTSCCPGWMDCAY